MKINGSKILITGGAGFVGSHTVDYLLHKDPKQIIVFDNFSRGIGENLKKAEKSGRLKIVNGDIRNIDQVNDLLKGVDYVFHQAAIRITRCAEEPRLCQEVLIDGTFNILESCVKNNVKKLIFSSSASVYGDPSYLPMDEKHPFNNTTAYGAAKIASEEMIKAFRAMYGLNYVILRYFNVYGPRMDIYGVYTEVLIKWLEKIDNHEAPIIHGDGKQSLDFVYVEDVAQANVKALESEINQGIYNVGTGKSTSLKELLDILLEETKSDLKPVYEPVVKRPYVQKRCADTSLAKKEIKFSAKLNLNEGLRKLIVWRKKQLQEKAKI